MFVNWTVLDGIGLHSMVFDGIGWYWVKLDGIGWCWESPKALRVLSRLLSTVFLPPQKHDPPPPTIGHFGGYQHFKKTKNNKEIKKL